MDSVTSWLCPVCGFDLGFPPWEGQSASDEICPCCFIQFGYDDWKIEQRLEIYRAWRNRWIQEGMKWRGISTRPSKDWDPIEQLRRIGIEV